MFSASREMSCCLRLPKTQQIIQLGWTIRSWTGSVTAVTVALVSLSFVSPTYGTLQILINLLFDSIYLVKLISGQLASQSMRLKWLSLEPESTWKVSAEPKQNHRHFPFIPFNKASLVEFIKLLQYFETSCSSNFSTFPNLDDISQWLTISLPTQAMSMDTLHYAIFASRSTLIIIYSTRSKQTLISELGRGFRGIKTALFAVSLSNACSKLSESHP